MIDIKCSVIDRRNREKFKNLEFSKLIHLQIDIILSGRVFSGHSPVLFNSSMDNKYGSIK